MWWGWGGGWGLEPVLVKVRLVKVLVKINGLFGENCGESYFWLVKINALTFTFSRALNSPWEC